MSDRTVHAAYKDMEIVRYDRAGKWFFEPTDQSLPRQQTTIDQAVSNAVWGIRNAGGKVFFGRPGGNSFDRKVRKQLGIT